VNINANIKSTALWTWGVVSYAPGSVVKTTISAGCGFIAALGAAEMGVGSSLQNVVITGRALIGLGINPAVLLIGVGIALSTVTLHSAAKKYEKAVVIANNHAVWSMVKADVKADKVLNASQKATLKKALKIQDSYAPKGIAKTVFSAGCGFIAAIAASKLKNGWQVMAYGQAYIRITANLVSLLVWFGVVLEGVILHSLIKNREKAVVIANNNAAWAAIEANVEGDIPLTAEQKTIVKKVLKIEYAI
jgi:hypothetical protein